MLGYIQDGARMPFVASGAKVSGNVITFAQVGIGVVVADVADTETGELQIEGVVKLAAETGVAWSQGDRLYWNAGSAILTKTVGSNVVAGYAFEAKGSSAAVGKVKLVPMGDTDPGQLAQSAVVAALTDGTMTGTANGAMELVGATNSGDVSGAIMNNFKECQTQINAILTALKNAGLMATS